MVFTILAGFFLAALMPLLHRVVGRMVGWLAALLALGVAGYFASWIPVVAAGDHVHASYAWAPQLGFNASFHLDGLSLLFVLLISGMGGLIAIYASGYMKGHPALGSFYAFILMFMVSMLGVALSSNLITLFVFWELTTVSSYLLIGFDHENKGARAAALQALLVTSMGGLALLAGLLLLAHVTGSYELSTILARREVLLESGLYLPILILVLLGAFTKSAQFPFHFWLPAAMAAPTPVSAYLHSATMVKAGVYLLARLHPLLGNTEYWHGAVIPFGMITMLIGAWLAFNSSDLKQILAYSTLAILGTLTMLFGIGSDLAITAAMVTWVAHALYKGALFLVAGAVDHGAHQRDIRHLRGLRRSMPLTAVIAAIAGLSMAGFPPLLGFLSKETIYEAVHHADYAAMVLTVAAVVAKTVLVGVAGLVCLQPFYGKPSPDAQSAHEAGLTVWLPPLVLAVLGTVFGIMPAWLEQTIIASSVAAVAGQSVEVHLVLWHGLTTTLALSALTLVVGALLYVLRHPIRRFDWLHIQLARLGPAQIYVFLMFVLNGFARGQTRVLQNGSLRLYLMTLIVSMIGLIAFAMATAGVPFHLPDMTSIYISEMLIVCLILLAVAFILGTHSRLGAIVGLGVLGYGVAVIYVLYGAPDLALTQFVIETLTVILMILVFHKVPHFRYRMERFWRLNDALVAVLAGGSIGALLLFAISIREESAISQYYVENSLALGHGRNIVNVILVDFRAIDTLGEITVLAVAGVGVYALLGLRLHDPHESHRVAPPSSTAVIRERPDPTLEQEDSGCNR